jgi:hypothetical protein
MQAYPECQRSLACDRGMTQVVWGLATTGESRSVDLQTGLPKGVLEGFVKLETQELILRLH